ncbi:hypothetical protein [Micromonospora sp. bgisy143]|uniref:hypothetical protein n=1 Tax=Micromonospora sp. bgisy143 TaxID=3413790 RepID=UPI003EBA8BAD
MGEQWSIYWMNSGRGELEQPPMVGRFVDGVGRFYADDQHEGRPVRCRFIWSGITATTAAGSRRIQSTANAPGRRTGS